MPLQSIVFGRTRKASMCVGGFASGQIRQVHEPGWKRIWSWWSADGATGAAALEKLSSRHSEAEAWVITLNIVPEVSSTVSRIQSVRLLPIDRSMQKMCT